MEELLKELHGIDTDTLGELQYLQGRLIGKLEAYKNLGYEMTEEEVVEVRDMINTYLCRDNIIVSPRLKIELLVNDEGHDGTVVSIPGFGRWLVEHDGHNYFAIDFLPADDQFKEFESLAFFWHDWFDDIVKTEGLEGYSFQYEYTMYHIGSKVNVIS